MESSLDCNRISRETFTILLNEMIEINEFFLNKYVDILNDDVDEIGVDAVTFTRTLSPNRRTNDFQSICKQILRTFRFKK